MGSFDEKFCLDVFERLLAADSTTGQYEEIETVLGEILRELGV